AADADATKARTLIRGLPGNVPIQRLQEHVTQLQYVEREVEHEPRSLGAEALTAALAERDAELCTPMGVDDLKKAGGPHGCAIATVVDRKLDGSGLALRAPVNVLLHPLLLALGSGDAQVIEAAPDLELVHPARVGGSEVAPQGPQRDLLA